MSPFSETARSRWSLGLALLCCGCVSDHREDKIEHVQVAADPPGIKIAADEVLTRWQALARSVEVQRDPIYESPKRFRAIPLAEILVGIGCSNSNFEVHIRCKDGYLAWFSGPEGLDGTGFLAFADETSPDRPGFAPLRTKSGLVDPGPLYLFWTPDTGDRPRPYQIEQIEICSTGDTLARARPSGSALAGRGFELFKKACSSCHAINGAGGRVGVDLNIPMNVTEYWKKEALRKLLTDPLTVRANAKMPALHLGRADADAVIAYLEDMRRRKIF